MQTFYIPTDESMRSTLAYGTDEFPFAYYLDEIEAYNSRCVEWHWHREFELSLVVKGNVSCKIGHESICLGAGDGLFINSKTIHRFETTNGGTLKNLIFLPEFIAPSSSAVFRRYVQPFLSADCECVILKHDDKLHDRILQIISEICETVKAGKLIWELQTQRLVLSLWQELYMQSLQGLNKERLHEEQITQARLREMLSYIHKNYGSTISLGDISKAANISSSEALRCFHAGIQTTPVRYLNNYRLRRAKSLLLATGDTITAIASAVGFESTGYFCRVFKAEYGYTPNEFRKMH
ncbi:MAG: helix-turn-helix domain-containing protein [Oscillospiraceae bacterium]